MAGQFQLLSLLLVFAIVGGGLSSSLDVHDAASTQKVSARVDLVFDKLLPTIQRTMLENGMDPMPLSDFSARMLPLPGKLKGNIDFTAGWAQELSSLRRAKHVIATFHDKKLQLEMNLGWKILDFNYEYALKYLLYTRTGDVYGRLHDAEIQVVITLDFNTYRISLDSIDFSRVGKFDLKFEGRILDPVVNAAAKAVTTIFRQTVLNMVQERALIIFREVVDDVNAKIPKPDRVVDGHSSLSNA